MEKRRLGNSELYVNSVGLGCMGFSHASGDPTEKSVAVRTLREAADMGYDFFDTVEAYTGVNPDGTISYNEELVGEAVKGIRDKVVIATKMGGQPQSGPFSEAGQQSGNHKKKCRGQPEETGNRLHRFVLSAPDRPEGGTGDCGRDYGPADKRREDPLLGDFRDNRRISPQG